jgi:hypothetical protein
MRTLKTTILFTFFAFTANSNAQEFLPKIEIENGIGPNDTMCYTITNSEESPMSFYPKVAYFPGGEFITFSEDSLSAWLHRQVTLPGEAGKIQMVNAIAYVIKSLRFVNRLGMYDHVNGVGHKKYSPIGWFSHYHVQCGDFMRYGYHLLHNAYNVPLSELREHSIDGQHTLGEIKLYGRWTKIDFDPGTPSFMTENLASPNGFANIADIVADTSLLVEGGRYLYADTLNLTPWFTMEEHRENFIGDTQYYGAVIENNFEVAGTWTLCAGCTLEEIIPVNNNLIYLDPETPEVQQGYMLYLQYLATGDPAYYIESISQLADLLDITVEEAMALEQADLLTTEIVTLSSQLTEHYDTIAPTLVLRIPPTTEPLEIGRYGDVHLPFVVTSVETAGTVELLDTVIGQSGFQVQLWNDDSLGLAEAYPALNSEVNFLNEGWVDSPNGETTIRLAFNPMIYPVGQVDIELHNVTFPGNLLVQAEICNGDNSIVTSTENEDINSSDVVSLYPNPTTGDFLVTVNGAPYNKYEVYDSQGRIVSRIEKLARGLYIVLVEHNDKTFSKKKLIIQ